MSLYTEITKLPRDPIIGLTELFKNDKRATKYNLGVGVYLDEDGNIPILDSVKKATQILYEKKDPSVYLPMGGLDSFCEATKKLLFGPAHSSNENVMTTQALGGTGALRLGAELLQRTKKVPLVVISEPSWENHRTIFESAGFKVNTYPYYDPNTNCFLLDQFLTFLKSLPKNTVVILHANCHNPTGIDPSEEQWKEILDNIQKLDLDNVNTTTVESESSKTQNSSNLNQKITEINNSYFERADYYGNPSPRGRGQQWLNYYVPQLFVSEPQDYITILEWGYDDGGGTLRYPYTNPYTMNLETCEFEDVKADGLIIIDPIEFES